ncbi:methylase involved in ubiquinone/menaquinone biosynthesis [Chthonomonas calidirosea]|uniref:Methylase involved in ubiquinone/menaquinone biosynthesis n=1 Tax=Chthonomonas calidirosea (strain DSM 23976 / ICMP 18418 / T49) TaxID=1303518 RepID=S0EWD7_CHTCT|nr:class I SAM-dependent methyltransferase [Chthonomonas calidirosea]CCW34003.1 Methylase involved in ubiquinone/menaquinone biosynthesis [Chthonomonas calidirosea T49]CEK16039.1 methylase involved in ubiquinone/menaquinone biosynthesis [Chthonomonas calidirosea]
MKTAEYERMYRLEEAYWWFVGRQALLEQLLQRFYGNPAKKEASVILDVGCGTGAISRRLTQWGRVVSTDFSALALEYSRKRGLRHLVRADAMRLPLATASFDLAVCMDVLEHLPDDQAALCELFRVLKPGGRLIATVPAYPHLWGEHDLALMHFRRYMRRELEDRVNRVGFRIQKITHVMTLLYPAVALQRRLLAKRPPHDPPQAAMPMVPEVINRALIALLKLENRLACRFSLPFGLTILCVAERPEALEVESRVDCSAKTVV